MSSWSLNTRYRIMPKPEMPKPEMPKPEIPKPEISNKSNLPNKSYLDIINMHKKIINGTYNLENSKQNNVQNSKQNKQKTKRYIEKMF